MKALLVAAAMMSYSLHAFAGDMATPQEDSVVTLPTGAVAVFALDQSNTQSPEQPITLALIRPC